MEVDILGETLAKLKLSTNNAVKNLIEERKKSLNNLRKIHHLMKITNGFKVVPPTLLVNILTGKHVPVEFKLYKNSRIFDPVMLCILAQEAIIKLLGNITGILKLNEGKAKSGIEIASALSTQVTQIASYIEDFIENQYFDKDLIIKTIADCLNAIIKKVNGLTLYLITSEKYLPIFEVGIFKDLLKFTDGLEQYNLTKNYLKGCVNLVISGVALEYDLIEKLLLYLLMYRHILKVVSEKKKSEIINVMKLSIPDNINMLEAIERKVPFTVKYLINECSMHNKHFLLLTP